MSTGFIYHDRFLDHDTGQGHPERPDRLRALVRGLDDAGLRPRLKDLPFEAAPMQAIQHLHDQAYLDRLKQACERGAPFIDAPDSAICPDSEAVARLAVGGALAAVDAVMAEQVANAFCAIRPPGHHAERDRSMGFCLYNNVAIAAEHLIRQHKLTRVAVVDFDVHHGNGTQHLFERRSDVLFISVHQHPATLYPGTGFAEERGEGAGLGYTLNVPLAPHGGDDVYRKAFEEKILPKLDDFRPEALLVSAGFDAARDDPLAQMRVSADGFEWMAQELNKAAAKHAGGRCVMLLEGGYDLPSLAAGVQRCVKVLLG